MSLKPNQRLPLMAMGMLSLLAAIWGGLQRLGWELPTLTVSLPVNHGSLMVGAFLGTVIGLERAVALGRPWGYIGPLTTGLGGLLLLSGKAMMPAQMLILTGSALLSLVFLAFNLRQFAWFTVIMALGAVSWLAGNLLWFLGKPVYEVVWWWMGFLLLTIAGERMELGRMLLLTRLQQGVLLAAVGVASAGILYTLTDTDIGVRTLGVGMVAIALWLSRFDVARRTIRQDGLIRFIAVNLLAGYLWLAATGLLLLLIGTGFSGLRYDAVLHTFFLGFVFSMIFGHAPVIFPAVLGRGMLYRPAFYLHVGLLHLFLLIRIGGDLATAPLPRNLGGLLNGLTLVVFIINTVLSVRAYAAAQKD